MKKLLYLFLIGLFLIGCSNTEMISEEEIFMQNFLQTAYTLKITNCEFPRNQEKLEAYWTGFYESISELCTEEAYNKITASSFLADRALDAHENGYEISIKDIQLEYDKELLQAKYMVVVEKSYADNNKETEEIEGYLVICETEEGEYKVQTMREV